LVCRSLIVSDNFKVAPANGQIMSARIRSDIVHSLLS
jgi:hypothetical protein